MVTLINLLLKITWRTTFGTKLKFRLKQLNYQFKKVSWSISLYKTSDDFKAKKWQKIIGFYWFSIKKTALENQISGFADPFLVSNEDKLYLFFEAIVNNKGEIWSAEIIKNKPTAIQKVICESFHLSYPNVFKYKHDYYMLPESNQANAVRLYKATEFPTKWEFNTILHNGSRFVDTNLLALENTFYWFTFDLDSNQTRLFYSESIFSEWIEHQQSPMASNRNAGNFIFEQNEFLRPVQIAKNHYGQGVKLMKIIVLNKEVFQEEECINPFLSSKKGYNLDGTHHISLIKFENKTIIATDGKNNNFYSVVNN